ncbi:AP-3 complex subunit delta-1 isoform X2 [Hyalella azteca]|uniref:AP-3 complex subunit delta n=1 Tax=Hyalella azteca TaxID=294128 RepID=A0A8B7NQP9_HYAAZ|nr:AP-3 complex subunit delta-1 isoform X2 [Hyalella azteca]
MALRKVKGNLERMFDKNLTDLVRGIRNNKDNEGKYIAQCMDEIKAELRQENFAVKANAVAKLTYLQMLGYDISWAGFNIVEVMSSSKFTYKRIGYLAASQCFHQDTEVVMLTTNMIRKDLNGQNMYDAGTALTGLACFISADLARDLANDVMTLLSSTKPYLRKKAVLLLYKVFLKFPEALRPAFPRLKEKLEDPDPGVQSAAVNVICELARKNPKNYLSLAPVFFKLMTSSTNNWMLIKIIKLFGALTPLEPRLGKKLIEPLTNLIHSTSAMSLLYECINTVIAGMPNHNASIQLCVQKLRILIEDSDQNLKYLGLLAMGRILGPHPKAVQPHKDLVLACLDDKDESIRIRALDLLYGMVSKKTVMEIVRRLMTHMDRAEGTFYRDELLQKIIQICSQNNYQYITNFEWYISVLVELCRMESSQHGALIAAQLMDVAIRVGAVREFTVGQMALLLENAHLLLGPAAANSSIAEVLFAAAWICGEFAHLLPNARNTLEAIVRGRLWSVAGHIQAVIVHNLVKLFIRIVVTAEEEDDADMINEVTALLEERLATWSSSADLEVQERAVFALQLVCLVRDKRAAGLKLGPELALLTAGELNPVAPKAQKKVPVPDGLDLDAWMNAPPSESEGSGDEDLLSGGDLFFRSEEPPSPSVGRKNRKAQHISEEDIMQRRAARLQEQANNPYYMKTTSNRSSTRSSPKTSLANLNVDEIPMQAIELDVPLTIPGMTSLSKYEMVDGDGDNKKLRHKKSKKRSKRKNLALSSSEEEEAPAPLVINTDAEMPEGAIVSDDDDRDNRPLDDPHRALDIDLDSPLSPTEVLPVLHHREAPAAPKLKRSSKPASSTVDAAKSKTKKDKSRKSKKKEKNGDLLGSEQKEMALDIGASVTDSKPKPYANGVDGKKTHDDIEFWLSTSDPVEQPPEAEPENAPAAADATQKSKATKKSSKEPKKEKKSKETSKKVSKKSSRKSELNLPLVDGAPSSDLRTPEGVDRRDYEVANGHHASNATPDRHKLLAEDSAVAVSWRARPAADGLKQIRLSLSFSVSSQLSDSMTDIRLVRLHLPDTSSLALTRVNATSSDIDLERALLSPGAPVKKALTVEVQDATVPHKLRGALYYSLNGGSERVLPLKFEVSVLCCLSGAGASREAFSELVSSGALTARSAFTTSCPDISFEQLLRVLCGDGSFGVVERVQNTASLYAASLSGHHVCLLTKLKDSGGVCVDGKASDGTLLANALDVLRAALTAAP